MRTVKFAAVIGIALSLPACAVVMSAQGDSHPIQSSRPDTVCEQGKPSSTGWAVAHAGLDVLTLGLWEVVGTPIEIARTSGDKDAVHCTNITGN